MNLRQEWTRDPWLQCLHLETHLLQQQKTKKLQGIRNCMPVYLGHMLDNKTPKDPTSYSWSKARGKSREPRMPPALSATKGVGRPPRTTLQPDQGPPHPPPHPRHGSSHTPGPSPPASPSPSRQLPHLHPLPTRLLIPIMAAPTPLPCPHPPSHPHDSSSHTLGNKLGCLLSSFSPTPCSLGPHRALPEFLVCPLINFYWLR